MRFFQIIEFIMFQEVSIRGTHTIFKNQFISSKTSSNLPISLLNNLFSQNYFRIHITILRFGMWIWIYVWCVCLHIYTHTYIHIQAYVTHICVYIYTCTYIYILFTCVPPITDQPCIFGIIYLY